MANRKKKTQSSGSMKGKKSVSPPPLGHARLTGGILRELFKGLLVIFLILAVKIALENTSIGKQLELAGYVYLQNHLSSDDVPIQVIDISDLEVSEIKTPERTYHATSRETLENIIEAIADQGPKAIGIDLDFSPDEEGYLTRDDPKFFDFCLNQDVPVFLGIYRTQLLPPEAWLANERYERLGASIIIPNENTVKMPASIQTSSQFKSGPTMSAALGKVLGETQCKIGESFRRMGLATKESKKELESGGGIVEFLVDYGPLQKISHDQTLRTSKPELIPAMIQDHGADFRNKIILIGRGTLGKAEDTFKVAGYPQPVPGIYIHACGAYTLGKAPLYELNWKGRLAIDVFMAGTILFVVIGVRLRLSKKSAGRVSIAKLQTVLTLVIVIAAISLGIVFVRLTCVMWSDFIMALGAVVLHPSIERRMASFWNLLKRIIKSIVRTLFLNPDQEVRK